MTYVVGPARWASWKPKPNHHRGGLTMRVSYRAADIGAESLAHPRWWALSKECV